MLKLPAFREYNDCSVFQDDDQFWRFYVIARFPSVRVDDRGNPVFLLIKYALSDASRAADPTLPRGGGYLSFDAELRVDEVRLAEIKADLQTWSNAEYERRRQLAQAGLGPQTVNSSVTSIDPVTAGHGATPTTRIDTTLTMPGSGQAPLPTTAPAVVIGEPFWKGGKVLMRGPEAAGLVRRKVGETPASLVGSNVAAFSMELTEDGASFMQGTLVGPSGTAATDLTPIQVVYDLTMLARLPPARAYVHVRMASLYHAMQEMVHTHSENGCDEDDYSTIESKLQTAIDAGMIEIKIDAGGVTDDTIIKQLTTQCQALVTKIVDERLVAREKKEREDKGWGDDAAGDEADVYRLKRETEVSLVDVQQTFELASTIEHTIHPQGTLETFLASSGGTMSRFVREVNLDDDFFKTLGLSVRAFANWEQDGIDFVEVEVLYEGQDEARRPVQATQTFTFTSASRDVQRWDPSLIGKQRRYSYRWTVGFEGRGRSEPSAWKQETTRNLNVSVETPGKLEVEVQAAGVDFTQSVAAAMVYLRYEDVARGIPREEATVVLASDKASAIWQKMLYAPRDRPLEYRVEYLLKPQGVLTKDWQSTTTNRIVVTDPFVDKLDVTLIPSGSWEDVQKVVVSLVYEDRANNYNVDMQVELKTPDEFKQWKVPLRDPRARTFRYRMLTTYKSGVAATETDWVSATGDQAIQIRARATPRLTVALMGAVVDFKQTPIVKVSLRYEDAMNGTQRASFTLTEQKPLETWSIPISDPARTSYRYAITYYPGVAPEAAQEEKASSDAQLVVPRYDLPRVGADVSAKFVDFAQTPLVEVTLSYDDAQRGVHEKKTLSFSDVVPQSWFVLVDAAAARQYRYQITYYVGADGTPVEAPAVDTDRTKLVLPRYKAAT